VSLKIKTPKHILE